MHMISIDVKESGLCLVRGIEAHGPFANVTYLRPIKKNPEIYWTGWRWLPLLKKTLQVETLPIASGRENWEALAHIARETLTMKEARKDGGAVLKLLDVILWPWQVIGAEILASTPRMYLADEVGLGKTYTLIAALAARAAVTGGLFPRTLVLCPSSVKYQWYEEVERVMGPRLKVSVVDGQRTERCRAWEEDARIYVANYESFARDASEKDGLPRREFDVLVLDEAWKVKNWRTKGCQAVAKFAREIPVRYALNATPVTNHYEDLYGVFSVLDPLLFLSWRNFQTRYMDVRLVKTGRVSKYGRPIVYQKLLGYKKVDEIRSLIAPHFLRRTAEDLLDARPEVTVAWYWVDLHPDQRVRYETARAEKDVNPLARTVAFRMACLLGAPEGENPKSRELLDLLDNALRNRRVVVFSESVEYLTGLEREIRRANIKVVFIQGQDSAQLRTRKQQAFTRGYAKVLLATAAGESGLNLQAADVVVNLDLPWSPARIQQRVGRVRPYFGSRERTVTVINILARNTIEEKVVRRVRQKLGDISRLFHGQLDSTIELIFDPEELVRIDGS